MLKGRQENKQKQKAGDKIFSTGSRNLVYNALERFLIASKRSFIPCRLLLRSLLLQQLRLDIAGIQIQDRSCWTQLQ